MLRIYKDTNVFLFLFFYAKKCVIFLHFPHFSDVRGLGEWMRSERDKGDKRLRELAI